MVQHYSSSSIFLPNLALLLYSFPAFWRVISFVFIYITSVKRNVNASCKSFALNAFNFPLFHFVISISALCTSTLRYNFPSLKRGLFFFFQDNWCLFKNEKDRLNAGNHTAGFTSMNYLQRLQINKEVLSIWYFPWLNSKYKLSNGLTVSRINADNNYSTNSLWVVGMLSATRLSPGGFSIHSPSQVFRHCYILYIYNLCIFIYFQFD